MEDKSVLDKDKSNEALPQTETAADKSSEEQAYISRIMSNPEQYFAEPVFYAPQREHMERNILKEHHLSGPPGAYAPDPAPVITNPCRFCGAQLGDGKFCGNCGTPVE